MAKIVFPNFTVRVNPAIAYRVSSIKETGMKECITPGCTKTFSRHIYSLFGGGEKEHHSGQCAQIHRSMMKKM